MIKKVKKITKFPNGVLIKFPKKRQDLRVDLPTVGLETMNHVPSTAEGIVKEICVEDGHPVEYGQTIVILE